MINLDLYPLLKIKATLKETSKDDSNPRDIQFLTLSEIAAISFDLVKRKYANSLGLSEEVASSVDAIVQLKEGILFIEFKNGKVENRKIKDKAKDSLLIFLDIVSENIIYSRNNIDFILVYNSEGNPLPNQMQKGQLQETPSRLTIEYHVTEKAKEELIRFGLEKYKKLYFRNVHTYTKEMFEEYLNKLGLG